MANPPSQFFARRSPKAATTIRVAPATKASPPWSRIRKATNPISRSPSHSRSPANARYCSGIAAAHSPETTGGTPPSQSRTERTDDFFNVTAALAFRRPQVPRQGRRRSAFNPNPPNDGSFFRWLEQIDSLRSSVRDAKRTGRIKFTPTIPEVEKRLIPNGIGLLAKSTPSGFLSRMHRRRRSLRRFRRSDVHGSGRLQRRRSSRCRPGPGSTALGQRHCRPWWP